MAFKSNCGHFEMVLLVAPNFSYIIYIREIGYLTDSKKVTITTIPRPMEQIYGKNFWKNLKIGPPWQEPPKFKQFLTIFALFFSNSGNIFGYQSL